jgi:hypothetical protein
MQGVERGESCCRRLRQGNTNDYVDSHVVRRRTVVSTTWPRPHSRVDHGGYHGDEGTNTTTPDDRNGGQFAVCGDDAR